MAIHSEAMKAKGIIVLVKPNKLAKISRQNNFSWLKLDFNPFFFAAKKPALSLLVGYNI